MEMFSDYHIQQHSWVTAHIPSKSPPALTSNVCLKKLTDETCKQDKCTCDCYSCSLKSDYHGAVCKSSRQLGEPRYLNKSLAMCLVVMIAKLQHFVSCQSSVYVHSTDTDSTT